jgi:SET domain-containing protein
MSNQKLTILEEPIQEIVSSKINTQKIDSKQIKIQPSFNPSERFQDNEYFQSKKIVIKLSSEEMGLGVFATEDIEKDELIERCPMIQMDWRTKYNGDPQLHRYLYTNSSCECEQCKIHGVNMFMVLGYGMIYNHQDKPNTKWQFNFKTLIGDVVAIKPIKKDEEIFVSYGPNYFKNRKKITV